ncbi:hypothetical protein QBC46DRAFT_161145 [Diplogelasinospora grovesii]|uniref:Uncharacterized protein n=1 Tax=Diplogelasinospora grovesii TaxID=303347 RepID=A0AAN6S342_9PEZI|nr:hypothetical protein QBC46DRAFT_161145 [Diplogelasinospora grovesii]
MLPYPIPLTAFKTSLLPPQTAFLTAKAYEHQHLAWRGLSSRQSVKMATNPDLGPQGHPYQPNDGDLNENPNQQPNPHTLAQPTADTPTPTYLVHLCCPNPIAGRPECFDLVAQDVFASTYAETDMNIIDCIERSMARNHPKYVVYELRYQICFVPNGAARDPVYYYSHHPSPPPPAVETPWASKYTRHVEDFRRGVYNHVRIEYQATFVNTSRQEAERVINELGWHIDLDPNDSGQEFLTRLNYLSIEDRGQGEEGQGHREENRAAASATIFDRIHQMQSERRFRDIRARPEPTQADSHSDNPGAQAQGGKGPHYKAFAGKILKLDLDECPVVADNPANRNPAPAEQEQEEEAECIGVADNPANRHLSSTTEEQQQLPDAWKPLGWWETPNFPAREAETLGEWMSRLVREGPLGVTIAPETSTQPANTSGPNANPDTGLVFDAAYRAPNPPELGMESDTADESAWSEPDTLGSPSVGVGEGDSDSVVEFLRHEIEALDLNFEKDPDGAECSLE